MSTAVKIRVLFFACKHFLVSNVGTSSTVMAYMIFVMENARSCEMYLQNSMCGCSFETSLLQKCQKLNNSQMCMYLLTHKQGFVDAPGMHLEINCLHCSGTSFFHRLIEYT